MADHDLIEPRRDYTADTLRRADLTQDPFAQFERWLSDARAADILDATAMSVATVDADGQPHSRMVLLKHFDHDGFVWYTNQDSDKARELRQAPRAAILFYWCSLERQIRVEGEVERLDPADADDYFHSRPEGSRFSAAASPQSRPVDDRATLERRVAALRERYPDGQVPRPDNWGGYRLRPARLEFWQGRSDRLHDRFVYLRDADAADHAGVWKIERLAP